MNHEDHEFSGSCPTCGQKYCGREIERLRAALRRIAEFHTGEGDDADKCAAIAAEALSVIEQNVGEPHGQIP